MLTFLEPRINSAEKKGINTKKAEKYFNKTQEEIKQIRMAEEELPKKFSEGEIDPEEYRKEKIRMRENHTQQAERYLKLCQKEVESWK